MKKKFKIEIIYNKKVKIYVIDCKYLGIATQGNNFKELWINFMECYELLNEVYTERTNCDLKMKKRYEELSK